MYSTRYVTRRAILILPGQYKYSCIPLKAIQYYIIILFFQLKVLIKPYIFVILFSYTMVEAHIMFSCLVLVVCFLVLSLYAFLSCLCFIFTCLVYVLCLLVLSMFYVYLSCLCFILSCLVYFMLSCLVYVSYLLVLSMFYVYLSCLCFMFTCLVYVLWLLAPSFF